MAKFPTPKAVTINKFLGIRTKDVKTGITSKVNSLILEEIFKSDELRENSYG